MITLPFFFSLVLGVLPDNDAELILVNGKKIRASIVAMDDTTVRIQGRERPILLKEIVEITFPKRKSISRPSGNSIVRGKENLRLHATRLNLSKNVLSFGDSNGQTIARIDRNLIQSIQLNDSIDDSEWKRVLAMKHKADGLVVKRENRLDVIEGVIKSMSNDSIGFQSNERLVSVNTSKLAGLLFFQGSNKSSQPMIELTDTHGNQFGGVSARLDGNDILLETSDGLSIQLPFARVVRFDYSPGRFVYLDTLTPVFQSWEPFVRANVNDPEIRKLIQTARDNKKAWTRNQSFGLPLMIDQQAEVSKDNLLGRKTYSKGISVRGGSRIIFDIPENAESIFAEIGIQAADHKLGSVDLVLQIDGKDVVKKRITSDQKVVYALAVPCPGERISFQVGYGGDSDIGDVLVLGNARFKLKQ